MSTPKKNPKTISSRGGGYIGGTQKKKFGQMPWQSNKWMGPELFFFQQKFVIFPTKKWEFFSTVKLTNFADGLRKNWNF